MLLITKYKEHCIINSQIKLKKLSHVTVFRDGGTLESYWLTSRNEGFIVTLEFDHSRSELYGQNFYRLYFCDAQLTKNNQHFAKNSTEAIQFLALVQAWIQDNQYTIDRFQNESLFEYTIGVFIVELFKGNY